MAVIINELEMVVDGSSPSAPEPGSESGEAPAAGGPPTALAPMDVTSVMEHARERRLRLHAD